MNRYLRRARSRLSRRPCWSRKISAIGAHHRRGLIGQHKSIEANAQVRFVGEPAADADRVPNFGSAPRSGQADVVDLRIRAPNRAAGDGNLEFARQIVKVVVPLERVRDCNSKRRSIDDFVVSDASQRAAGDVAHHVAAGPFRREPHGVERFHDLRQRLNGEPVVLDVLADGDVGKVPPVAARNFRKHASLVSPQNAVGDADPHHEVVGRLALAAFAPGHARAVPLRSKCPTSGSTCSIPRGSRSGRCGQRRESRQSRPRDSSRASDVRLVAPWFL